MARGNFKNFAVKLKSALTSKGYVGRKFAEESGIPQGTLSNYTGGQNAPTPENRIKLKRLLGMNDADFLPDSLPAGGINPKAEISVLPAGPAKRRAPILSWALAGEMGEGGRFEDLANQINDWVETDSKDPNCFAIEISGNSMEPDFYAQDYVIFEPNYEPRIGEPCLAKLQEGTVFFKFYYRTESKIRLESANEIYKPMEFNPEDFVWIYPAIDFRRRVKPRREKR